MDLNLPVYLDNNATTPMDPRVLEAMLPYFIEKYGNAASTHPFGWIAAEAVDRARRQVATLINATPEEIVFTSGATESDNLAIKGIFETYATKGNHIITVATEHKAVLDACRHIEKFGGEVTYLPVNEDGLIDLRGLESAITDKTILIAIMYGNNETGVLQPVREISSIARKHGIIFFSDATQAIGKTRVDVQADGIDLLALSGHKIYGPKGVGALYVRRKDPRVQLTAQTDGGGHEKGMRSGTLNVPGIVGLGKACEICDNEMGHEALRIGKLRDKLEYALLALEEVYVNGNRVHRLPQVSNLSFKYVNNDLLIASLNKDIAVSGGSACSAASPEPSHVLMAMGLDNELAHSSVRCSLGRFTTEEEVNFTIKRVGEAVMKLRKMNLV